MVFPARLSRLMETADQSLHHTGVPSGPLVGDSKKPGSMLPKGIKVSDEQEIISLSVTLVISTTMRGCCDTSCTGSSNTTAY